jgi:uncharacterized peroxidase-related enzyme
LHDLRDEVDDQEMVDRFAGNWREAGLGAATEALLAYAEKLTRSPAACGQDDVEALRASGWNDEAIASATQVVAYFNYINRIAEGLGVDHEDWIDELGRERDTVRGADASG